MPKNLQNISPAEKHTNINFYNKILQHIDEGFVVLNQHGIIISVSETTGNTFGYEDNEIIGTKALNYVFSEDQKRLIDCYKLKTKEGKVASYHLKIKPKSGDIKNVKVELFNHLKDNEINGYICRWIIEEEKGEKELEVNEWDDLKTIVETTSAGILINSENEILYANKAFRENVGLVTGNNKVSLKDFILKFVRKDYAKIVLHRAKARFENNESIPSKYEVPIVNTKGKEKWIEIYAKLINYKNTKLVIITVNDITKRKIAYLELENREHNLQILNNFATSIITCTDEDELLKVILDNCKSQLLFEKVCIYLLDNEGVKIKERIGINKNGFEALDKKNEKLIEDDIIVNVIDTVKSKIIDNTESYNNEKGSRLLIPIIVDRKIYGIIDSYHSQANYFSKNHLHLLETVAYLISVKISKLRFQDEILIKETRHKAVINAVPDFLLRLNLDGELLDLVDNSKSLSIAEEAAIGKKVENTPLNEYVTKEVLQAVRFAIKTDNPQTVIYSSALKQGNQTYESRIVKSGINEAVAIIRNISDRVRNEEKLQHVNIQLSDKNEELKTTLEELSNKNFELDQLMYKTSHDLRSPLRSMLGLIDILYSEEDISKIQEYLDYLKDLIKRLDTFIHDMLDYGKSSRAEVQLEKISFEELISNCISDLTFHENYDKIQTTLNFKKETEEFYSDPQMIKMVFSNIFSNAFRYYDFTKPDSFLNVKVDINQKEANIIIEDNGIGIAADKIDKVFNMFFRATNRLDGTGLGLYIVKQSIEKLNGEVTVNSENYKGTIFNICLPNLK